jgi:hypothetical protein
MTLMILSLPLSILIQASDPGITFLAIVGAIFVIILLALALTALFKPNKK